MRWLFGFVLLALHVTRAKADDRAALHYAAPAECAAAPEFTRRLSNRAGALSLPRDVQLDVKVEHGASWIGSVTLSRHGALLGQRELVASSCEEAVDALSFVAAMLLQESAPPRVKPAPVERKVVDPEPEPLEEPPPPPVIEAPVVTVQPPEPPPKRPAIALQGRAALSLSLLSGLSPRVQAGFGAEAGGLLRVDRIELTGVAGVRITPTTRIDGPATFSSRGGTFALCVGRSASITFSACASGEAGRLIARGSAPPRVRDPFQAFGPSVRAAMPLPLSFFVEARAAWLIAIRRDRFELSGQEVFRVSRLMFRGELALGMRFP